MYACLKPWWLNKTQCLFKKSDFSRLATIQDRQLFKTIPEFHLGNRPWGTIGGSDRLRGGQGVSRGEGKEVCVRASMGKNVMGEGRECPSRPAPNKMLNTIPCMHIHSMQCIYGVEKIVVGDPSHTTARTAYKWWHVLVNGNANIKCLQSVMDQGFGSLRKLYFMFDRVSCCSGWRLSATVMSAIMARGHPSNILALCLVS